jgi:hypothetical protein
MSGEDFDGRVRRELERLTDHGAAFQELMKCPALLSRLPQGVRRQLPSDHPSELARAFHALLRDFLGDAQRRYRDHPEDATAEALLTVGALMGLVPRSPGAEGVSPHAPGSTAYGHPRSPFAARPARTHRHLDVFQRELYGFLARFDAPRGPAEPPRARRSAQRRGLVAALAALAVLGVSVPVLATLRPWEEDTQVPGNDRVVEGRNAEDAEEDEPADKDPVTVVSVVPQDSGEVAWAFEDAQDFTPEELEPLDATRLTDETHAWFTDRGATPVGTRVDLITIAGNSEEPLVIKDIRVDKKCRAPLSGTLFQGPDTGPDDHVRLWFDLDEKRPTAQLSQGDKGSIPYFSIRTISLQQDEQQKILVAARTGEHYCEYTLNLSMTVGGRTVTQVVQDDDEPFRLSARLGKTPDDVSGYRRLYVGGAHTARCGGAFREADPQTWPGAGGVC